MENNADINNSARPDHCSNSSHSYLIKADKAADSGDYLLGIHLFLAAFEKSLHESFGPSDEVLEGMDRAWGLAIATRQRSLAEYIFETLEPYWNKDQIEGKAEELQRLAFDKLEEVGVSRDALEKMADLVDNNDIFSAHPRLATSPQTNVNDANTNTILKNEEISKNQNVKIDNKIDSFNNTNIVKTNKKKDKSDQEISPDLIKDLLSDLNDEETVEKIKKAMPMFLNNLVDIEDSESEKNNKPSEVLESNVQHAKQKSHKDEASKESNSNSANKEVKNNNLGIDLKKIASDAMENSAGLLNALGISPIEINATSLTGEEKKQHEPTLSYKNIVGYNRSVQLMKQLGIGRKNDPAYREFIALLNKRHGVFKPPSLGTVIFTGEAREDVSLFMIATAGEMQIPAIRMRMERNALGQSVLVVMASPDFKTRLNNIAKTGFSTPTVLILEDLDLWALPDSDPYMDETASIISRGAREALMMIGLAMDSPDVNVFISASDVQAINPFFMDFVSTYEHVPIDLPNEIERQSLWQYAQNLHPSMRGLDVKKLVRYSNLLSRYEINYIISESIEEAYRNSLKSNKFVAVHTEDIYLRLAGYLPTDSEEYIEIEQYVLNHFSTSLDAIDSWDDLIK